MKEKPKKKGGKRMGAGRKPSARKTPITVYADDAGLSRFGGREGARIVFYELLAGKITITEKVSFLPIDSDLSDSIQKAKKEAKEVKIKDLTSPTGVLKPQEQPKTNLEADTRPKTLDELKSRCPVELKGIDRTIWISEQKEKYGIKS